MHNNQFDSTCTSISKATMYSFELKFTPLNLKILSKRKLKLYLNKNNPTVEVICGKYKDKNIFF